MTPFDVQVSTRVVFGEDSIDRLGELSRQLNCNKALVVSDTGIVKAGHVQRGVDSLEKSGVTVCLFDEAVENPTTAEVQKGLEVAKDFQPDLLIGLGGGSSMDCAKGVNFLYSNGGRMQDYHGVGKATKPMLPMVAVPTTAGTGSEMQSFALISDAESHVKMACGDKKAACRVAILDPKLTVTQPAQVTALTGIDALSHALETFVTKIRNPMSLGFSRESFRMLANSFPKVLNDPNDLAARAEMQLGASYAGMAIEASMLGASHALANPLTATYGIAHGQAVGMMLPHVIRYNGELFADQYTELASLLANETVKLVQMDDSKFDRASLENGQATEGLSSFVQKVVSRSGLKTRLSECGVEKERLSQLASDASQQWTGTFNPREVDQSSLLSIYEQAF